MQFQSGKQRGLHANPLGHMHGAAQEAEPLDDQDQFSRRDMEVLRGFRIELVPLPTSLLFGTCRSPCQERAGRTETGCGHRRAWRRRAPCLAPDDEVFGRNLVEGLAPVPWLTPRSAASSGSLGSNWPGSQMPSAIRLTMESRTCR